MKRTENRITVSLSFQCAYINTIIYFLSYSSVSGVSLGFTNERNKRILLKLRKCCAEQNQISVDSEIFNPGL